MPQSASKKFPGIFVSYRRDDSSGHAGRLFDRLSAHFGDEQIFMDIDHIEPGEDFVEVIENAVGSCEILIAIIGQHWLSSVDESSVRLNNPNDFVRLEIVAALKRDIRVIPVLVQGASMPKPQDLPEDLLKLSRRHALELSDLRWKRDVDQLIGALEKILAQRGDARRRAQEEAARVAAEERLRQETEAPQLEAARRRAEELQRREAEEAARRIEAERERHAAEAREAEAVERIRAEENLSRRRADLPITRRAPPPRTLRSSATEDPDLEPSIKTIKAPSPELVGRHSKAASIAETGGSALPAQIHAAGPVGKRRAWMLVAGVLGPLIVGAIGLWLGLGILTRSSTSNGEQSSGQQNVAPANNSGGAPTPASIQSTSQPTNASNDASRTSASRNAEKRPASAKPLRAATPAPKRPQDNGAAERQKKALDALRNPRP